MRIEQRMEKIKKIIENEAEGLVKRQVISQGNTVIAVADHTKLDTTD